MLFQDVISDMAARPPFVLSCFISYHRDFDYKNVNLRNFNSFWLVCRDLRSFFRTIMSVSILVCLAFSSSTELLRKLKLSSNPFCVSSRIDILRMVYFTSVINRNMHLVNIFFVQVLIRIMWEQEMPLCLMLNLQLGSPSRTRTVILPQLQMFSPKM